MKLALLFLKKITFRKIINAVSVYFYYGLSVVFKTIKRGGYPLSISVEPGTSCNLQCKECPSGQRSFTRPAGNIELALFKQILDEFAPYLLDVILYFQGEPFLHKQFFDLVRYASLEKKVFTITSTNGHYLTIENSQKIIESGLDKIIISFDGTTQDVYQNYRIGGNLERVKQGIQNIVEQRKLLKSKAPYIELQFIVFRHNEHQISEVKKLAADLGVDKLALKTAQIYDYKNNTELIPTIDKYSRYKKDKEGNYQIKSKLPNRCKRLWEALVVTWDGDILPCCFDKDADHRLGNLTQFSFNEIESSDVPGYFRKTVITNRKSIPICRNCSEGLKL